MRHRTAILSLLLLLLSAAPVHADDGIKFSTRPLIALNDPAQVQPVYAALGKGKTGPEGLKVLQAARLKQPGALLGLVILHTERR